MILFCIVDELLLCGVVIAGLVVMVDLLGAVYDFVDGDLYSWLVLVLEVGEEYGLEYLTCSVVLDGI